MRLIGFCKHFFHTFDMSRATSSNIRKLCIKFKYLFLIFSDRIRTTNNILGDCYAAAIVEKFSKNELQELDKAITTEIHQTHGEPEKKFSLHDSVLV